MRRIIAGGTGFIGQYLVKQWLDAGSEVIVIGRSKEKIQSLFSTQVSALAWSDIDTDIHTQALFKSAQVVVNLCGANIAEGRWTDKRKQEILSSRIQPTTTLAGICAALGESSPPLFNASGVGIYGAQSFEGEESLTLFDEDSKYDDVNPPDFLSLVAHRWEQASQTAIDAGVRVVPMRFGAVLSRDGGVMKKMWLPFLWGLGGAIGSGKQPFSWVMRADVSNAINFLIDHADITGAVNIVAPQRISQLQFAKAFAKALHRPCILLTPAWVLKLLLGEMADVLLLNGQHVIPKRLLDAGFEFQYPTIEAALQACVKGL